MATKLLPSSRHLLLLVMFVLSAMNFRVERRLEDSLLVVQQSIAVASTRLPPASSQTATASIQTTATPIQDQSPQETKSHADETETIPNFSHPCTASSGTNDPGGDRDDEALAAACVQSAFRREFLDTDSILCGKHKCAVRILPTHSKDPTTTQQENDHHSDPGAFLVTPLEPGVRARVLHDRLHRAARHVGARIIQGKHTMRHIYRGPPIRIDFGDADRDIEMDHPNGNAPQEQQQQQQPQPQHSKYLRKSLAAWQQWWDAVPHRGSHPHQTEVLPTLLHARDILRRTEQVQQHSAGGDTTSQTTTTERIATIFVQFIEWIPPKDSILLGCAADKYQSTLEQLPQFLAGNDNSTTTSEFLQTIDRDFDRLETLLEHEMPCLYVDFQVLLHMHKSSSSSSLTLVHLDVDRCLMIVSPAQVQAQRHVCRPRIAHMRQLIHEAIEGNGGRTAATAAAG